MDILLVIPPYVVDADGRGVVPETAMLPVGPLAVAAAIRARGHRVRCLDLTFVAEWQNVVQHETQRPDILLLSCHTIRNIEPCIRVLAAQQEQWRNIPHVPHVILGGNVCLQVGIEEFSALGLSVHAVVRGYGHTPEVIQRILEREQGDIRAAQVSAYLPIPALDLLDAATHEHYRHASDGRYPIIGHGVGCLWNCSYCTAVMGSRWVERPLGDVERELCVAKAYGYERLWCVDNLTLVDPNRTIAFDAMVARHSMTWLGMDRPELVAKHAGVLKQLRALNGIAMGVESASVEQLAVFKRGVQATYQKACITAFHALRDAGIESIAFVMLDLPGSTEEDFWMLMALLRACAPDTVSWSFYNPPANAIMRNQQNPSDFGFYRWPMGYAQIAPTRTVQEAMLLAGVYWCGWTLASRRHFFANQNSIGVRFREGTIFFRASAARSPIGDVWRIWLQNERRTP